jgi:hypothetical protein
VDAWQTWQNSNKSWQYLVAESARLRHTTAPAEMPKLGKTQHLGSRRPILHACTHLSTLSRSSSCKSEAPRAPGRKGASHVSRLVARLESETSGSPTWQQNRALGPYLAAINRTLGPVWQPLIGLIGTTAATCPAAERHSGNPCHTSQERACLDRTASPAAPAPDTRGGLA